MLRFVILIKIKKWLKYNKGECKKVSPFDKNANKRFISGFGPWWSIDFFHFLIGLHGDLSFGGLTVRRTVIMIQIFCLAVFLSRCLSATTPNSLIDVWARLATIEVLWQTHKVFLARLEIRWKKSKHQSFFSQSVYGWNSLCSDDGYLHYPVDYVCIYVFFFVRCLRMKWKFLYGTRRKFSLLSVAFFLR